VRREPANSGKQTGARVHRGRFTVFATIGAGVMTILAACSSPDAPATITPTPNSEVAASKTVEHNLADVAFVQMMINSHVDATDLAGLAQQTSGNERVRELAERINVAQGPEINQMRDWLERWGAPAPEDSEMSGMAHDGMSTGGIDQRVAMITLLKLDGKAFDRKFLNLMDAHHRVTLAIARKQLSQGQSAAAIALARSIITVQESEIAEMQTLLRELNQ